MTSMRMSCFSGSWQLRQRRLHLSEFSAEWITDELLHHPFEERPHDKFYITKEDREELLKLLEFWKGKTVSEAVEEKLTEDMKKGSEMGKKVYMTNLYHYGGVGHFVMDYEKLMRLGFPGLIEEVKEAAAACQKAAGKLPENRNSMRRCS